MSDGDFLDDLDDMEEQAPPGADDADSGNIAAPSEDTSSAKQPASTRSSTLPTEEPKKSPRQQVTLYADEAEFMVKWVGPLISRRLSTQAGSGLRWDRDWWRYPEVAYRARLLWGTFEVARSDPDPAKLETWTRQVLDYHLGVILNGTTGPMNAEGPMKPLGASYPLTHPKRQEHEARTTQREQRAQRRAEKERAQRSKSSH